jgi:hypothetical protein
MIKRMIPMVLGIFCVGVLFSSCQRNISDPISNSSTRPEISFIIADDTTAPVFNDWRPPISLDKPFHAGMNVPVKFIVLDWYGNPMTTGVETYVKIGDSVSENAVLCGAGIGQWMADIILPEAGTYYVTLHGNVTNIRPLLITVIDN